MSFRHTLTLVFFVAATTMLIVTKARATEVMCPICGQIFKEDTETCPNEGTDLKLFGHPVEKKGEDTGTVSPGKDDDTEKDKIEEKGERYQEDPGLDEGDLEVQDTSGYRRHDQGEHRRTVKPDKDATYTDRRSRLKIRRGSISASEQGQEEEEEEEEAARRRLAEKDQQLLNEFDRRRQQLWSKRQLTRHAEIRAQKGRAAARENLLNSLGAPLTSLGYRVFWMGEGDDSGPVNTVEIDLNLARYWLRAGLSSLIGIRFLSGRNDLVFLEHISAGFQWPGRFSPYVVVRGGVGILASERFGADFVYLLSSVGVEIGIDSWITPWIAITPSFGYERCMLNDAYWNSSTFKISVGF